MKALAEKYFFIDINSFNIQIESYPLLKTFQCFPFPFKTEESELLKEDYKAFRNLATTMGFYTRYLLCFEHRLQTSTPLPALLSAGITPRPSSAQPGGGGGHHLGSQSPRRRRAVRWLRVWRQRGCSRPGYTPLRWGRLGASYLATLSLCFLLCRTELTIV